MALRAPLRTAVPFFAAAVSAMAIGCESPDTGEQADTTTVADAQTDGTPQPDLVDDLETVGIDAADSPDASDAVDAVDQDGASDGSNTSTGDTSTPPDLEDDTAAGCDRSGLGPLVRNFYSHEAGGGYELHEYFGETNNAETLQVLLYEPVEVGRFGLDASFADCTRCVFIGADCTDGGCQDWYVATSGELSVTRLDTSGGRMEGRLSEVTLVEHVEDPAAGTWVPRPGGRTWCVDDVAFGADIPTSETGYRLLPQTSLSPRVGEYTTGDAIHESACPVGSIAVGFDGTWYEGEGVTVLDSLRVRCADPEEVPLDDFLNFGPTIGAAADYALESTSSCPDGQIMVGVEAAFNREASVNVMSGATARCADIGTWADPTAPTPAVTLAWWVGEEGSARFDCPRGAAIVSLRADAEVKNLGFGFYVRFHSLRAECQRIEPL